MTITFLTPDEQNDYKKMSGEVIKTHGAPKSWGYFDWYYFGYLKGLVEATNRNYDIQDNEK